MAVLNLLITYFDNNNYLPIPINSQTCIYHSLSFYNFCL
nr:MAG TPA: hypothetical protein [Caudoviricetes sp.]